MSVASDTEGRSGSRGTGAGCASAWSSAGWVALSMQLAHLLVEVAEEVVGDLFRRRVDQARADLRELPADVRLDVVGEARRVALRRKAHLRAALREPGGAALAFERDRVRARRLDVGERELALELRAHRTNARHHEHLVLVVADRVDRFAARHALLQHRRIVQRVPRLLLGGWDQLLRGHFHARVSSLLVMGPLNALARSSRLSRLCTGRKRSTCGSIARTPAGRASNLS